MREIVSEVFNTDCVEYMRALPDKFFELAICDPPYGGVLHGDAWARRGKRFGGWFDRYKPQVARPFSDCRADGEETKAKKGTIDWDTAPPQEYWEELFRVSKNQVVWGGNYFPLPPTRCFVVWRKSCISESFSMAMAEYAWTSFNANAKVFEGRPRGDARHPRIHACQKPVALYQFLLRHFAREGDKVFDPNMGSQSSRIAAWGMGFDYWGCEIDGDYFRQGCARFERECRGVTITEGGRTLREPRLF